MWSNRFASGIRIVAISCVLIATALAYVPGLNGPFVFDDIVNIVENDGVAIQSLGLGELYEAVLANRSGFLGRPWATISFALNYYFAGGFAATIHFKLTNLATHLVNGLLVFWLVKQIVGLTNLHDPAHNIGTFWLPLAATATWLLHPLQVSSVLYVVQRMNSLSALFVLVGLNLFVLGRRLLPTRPAFGVGLIAAGLAGGTILGVGAKENAALLPLYALLLELLFLRHRQAGIVQQETPLRAIHAASILGIAALALIWLGGNPARILDGYRLREFTLTERLLTESRALWLYVSLVFFPVNGRLTLFHDDVAISTSLLDPWTTLPALLGIGAVATVAVILRKHSVWFTFAVAWFLVGHSMESTVISLELIHEHRNYLPSVGPIVATIVGLNTILRSAANPRLAAIVLFAPPILLAIATNHYARAWADAESLTHYMLSHHPESARTQATWAERQLRVHNNSLVALNHYYRAAQLAPFESAYLLRMATIAGSTTAKISSDSVDPPKAGTVLQRYPWGNLVVAPGSASARLALDDTLYSAIEEKLTEYPVNPRTLLAMNSLAECLTRTPPRCIEVRAAAQNWYRAALKNPRSLDSIRVSLLLDVVRIALHGSDKQSALSPAEEAFRLAASDPTVMIMLADVYRHVGKFDAASRLIERIKAESRLSPAQQAQVRQLESILNMRLDPSTSPDHFAPPVRARND